MHLNAWNPRTPVTVALIVIALVASALAIWIALDHQLFPSIGTLRISIRNPRNPAAIATIAAALAMWLDRTVIWERIGNIASRLAVPAAAAIGIVVLLGAGQCGARAVGASDSSGYANEARLLRALTVKHPLPLSSAVDWPEKDGTFSPLGFKPTAAGGAIVPTYPPGYPAMLAAVAALAGEDAIFVVVPLCAALSVWVAFLIGRSLAGPVAGLCTAILLAVSPTFLFQTFLPFSDIPATFLWTLSFYLLMTERGRSVTFLAGLAAGLACLVRPNLAVLAVTALPLIAWWKPDRLSRRARVLSFAGGLLPSLIGFAVWNNALYGSFVQTGYGVTGDMFSWHHVAPNVRRYASWLVSLHTPVLLLGLLAPFLLRPRAPDEPQIARHRRRSAICALVFVVCLQAFYYGYLVFDNWTFFRFMLPALPLLMALVATVFVYLLSRAWGPVRVLAGWLVVVGLVLQGLTKAERVGVFHVGRDEERYRQAAQAVMTQTPQNAVLFSMLHSGSLMFYTDRVIARWDGVPSGSLVRFANDLHGIDRRAYLVIDDLELADFQRTHAEEFARLPRATEFVLVDQSIQVRLFDLAAAAGH
jgi:hypothetical protein